MYRSHLVATLMAFGLANPSGAQDLEYGSIAVMPFGSASRDVASWESARILTRSVEAGVRESGRFMAVLERSAAMDARIQEELQASQGPGSFDSYIQISAESQMNASFLMDGFVETHEIVPNRMESGTVYYEAKVRLRVRIIDVQTRAVILTELLEVTNSVLETRKGDCSGLRGRLRCAAANALGSADESPEEAIGHVHENMVPAVRKFIEEKVSLLLIDFETTADDELVLVLLRAPDLDEDDDLLITGRRTTRMGGTRTTELGMAEITKMDDEYVYARVTQGHEEVAAALEANPFAVLIRPEND